MEKKASKLEKMADLEFRRLPKKEQNRICRMRRIPTAAPGRVFDDRRRGVRQKRWKEDFEE